jgi:hypothetical protein
MRRRRAFVADLTLFQSLLVDRRVGCVMCGVAREMMRVWLVRIVRSTVSSSS